MGASMVQQVIFVINIYTKKCSFAHVREPYARVFTADGEELAKYFLQDAGTENGLVVARLLRAPDGRRWSFQAIGQPCRGNVYRESLPAILAVGGQRPTEVQLRQLP